MKSQPATTPTPLALVLSETILVVDGHAELCEIASLLLQRCGYRVLTANHPEQAKQIARINPNIDLLLTDIEMPLMSGDALAQWFRLARPRSAVVFMSGNSAHYERLEPCHFVSKPFIHLDLLVNTVRAALDERHSAQQSAAA
jgi:CheY-like chemotaxis protein